VTSCGICPRTAPDHEHLCLVHSGELRAWLAELPRQARLLAAELAPPSSPAAGRIGGTGRAHAPVPVDLRVLVLLAPGHPAPPAGTDEDADTTVPILAFLDGWAGYLAYTYPAINWHPDRDPTHTLYIGACEHAVPRHGPTITGWCHYLTAYLPYALTHPWITDLHHQLGDLLAVIRGLTHTTPRHHPQGAPCPQCDAFALVRTDGRWDIHCRACGHHLDPDTYDQHAAQFLRTVQTEQADDPADAAA